MKRLNLSPSERVAYRAHQKAAIAAVAYATREGRLARLSEVYIACSDCLTRRATNYEHRDYDKPLEVRPVCAGCNNSSGAAKFSLVAMPEQIVRFEGSGKFCHIHSQTELICERCTTVAQKCTMRRYRRTLRSLAEIR